MALYTKDRIVSVTTAHSPGDCCVAVRDNTRIVERLLFMLHQQEAPPVGHSETFERKKVCVNILKFS
jgi:hypothetical protein